MDWVKKHVKKKMYEYNKLKTTRSISKNVLRLECYIIPE